MFEQLETMISDGSHCVEPRHLSVHPDEEDPLPWKQIMLAAICFNYAYNMVGILHERSILQDKKGCKAKYEKLDARIKKVYQPDVLEKNRMYRLGFNLYDILFPSFQFVFEFAVIQFDLPAKLWYGWLQLFQQRGWCESGSFSVWQQCHVSLHFFISFYAYEAILKAPLRYADMAYRRANGLSNATLEVFIKQQFVRFLNMNLMMEIPALYLASLLLTAFKKHFYVAVFQMTVFAILFTVYVTPKVSCLAVTYEDLPEENKELKTKILKEFKRVNYINDKVLLKRSRDGNLHSNASVLPNAVILGSKLLEHHKEEPDQIVAIAIHELGHWMYSHVNKMIVINAFYMLLIGVLMIPLIENHTFLFAFNIKMESYPMTIFLVYFLFKNSVHKMLSLPIKVYEHQREINADLFSVGQGYGKEMYEGMVQNFAQNQNFIFHSLINKQLNSSHPDMLTRLAAIDKATKEYNSKKVAPATPLLTKKTTKVEKRGSGSCSQTKIRLTRAMAPKILQKAQEATNLTDGHGVRAL